jgi:hypothetical protein
MVNEKRRGNREIQKPEAAKPAVAAPVSPFAAALETDRVAV